MKSTNNIELDIALKELLQYYPTQKELIEALDEILYALFFVDRDCLLPIELHNMAFTIKRLKKVILANDIQSEDK